MEGDGKEARSFQFGNEPVSEIPRHVERVRGQWPLEACNGDMQHLRMSTEARSLASSCIRVAALFVTRSSHFLRFSASSDKGPTVSKATIGLFLQYSMSSPSTNPLAFLVMRPILVGEPTNMKSPSTFLASLSPRFRMSAECPSALICSAIASATCLVLPYTLSKTTIPFVLIPLICRWACQIYQLPNKLGRL